MKQMIIIKSAVVSVLNKVAVYSHEGALLEIDTIPERVIIQIIQRSDEVFFGKQSGRAF